jgi:glycosyltransferase involved in cell wall biosynthesis
VDSRDDSLKADSYQLWLQLVAMEERCRAFESRLGRIEKSRSWRLTAPLRRASWLLSSSTALSHRPELQAASKGPSPYWPSLFKAAVPALELDPGFGGTEDARRCLLDVTELALEDLGGGVQRVTRRWLAELLASPPEGFLVEPVRLAADGGYALARRFLARFLGLQEGQLGEDRRLSPLSSDIFVGLDFCRDRASVLDAALGELKAAGAGIALVLPDMLPALHPEWFPDGIASAFEAWMKVCASRADRVVCISRDSALAMREYCLANGLASIPDTIVVPLGADLPVAVAGHLPRKHDGTMRLLMVGTLEPRKGHAQALDALDDLLIQGRDVELLIVGRRGWANEALFVRLREHPLYGSRLHWLEDADDGVLAGSYRDSDLLLMPSAGEGYGLPIGEAARAGCGLLLRDIPVFREVAGNAACFFSGTTGAELSLAVAAWLDKPETRADPGVRHWPTWEKSAASLKNETIGGLSMPTRLPP